MAEAHSDQNHATTALAWDGTTTKNLLVDPVTTRLEIAIVSTTIPAHVGPPARIDGNYVSTVQAVTDDAAQTVTPLICDSNGYLLVDITA